MILFLYTDKNCENQAIDCIRSLEPIVPDDMKIVYFTIGFVSTFSSKNLIKVPIPKREHANWFYYKPELSLEVMDMFPDETDFFYTDTDILFSPRMDFRKLTHTHPYPLAVYGPHEYPYTFDYVDGQMVQYNEGALMKYLNVPERTLRYQWACFYAYNRLSQDFLEEWASVCNNKYILSRQKTYLPFPDETALNVCLWKRKATESLGFIFVNTHRPETVKLLEETTVINQRLGVLIDNLGEDWEYVHDSNKILFYHGFKGGENTQEALNYLLSEKHMKLVYQRLRQHKKAYVVCAVGQSYIDATEGMIRLLNEYSQYPVILHYSNGVVNYEYDNLIKQPFRVKEANLNEEHAGKLLTTLKAEVTLNTVKNYDVDTVVMLDSDILPTPAIDTVFSKYESEVENYPIFLKYAWDIIYIMGRPLVSDHVQSTIGAPAAKIPAMCSCMCIATKNCISFLEDWKYWCENEEFLKYYYVDNRDIHFDFNDESIANALLWKYGATKYISCDLMWAWNHKSVKFAFDFYDGVAGELNTHESSPDHYRVPEEFEIPFGLSVLPKEKQNLLGFHGMKDLEHINSSIEEIKNRF